MMFSTHALEIKNALRTAINRDHFGGTARGKLQADIARTTENIEHLDVFKLNLILEDIEQRFFG